MPTYYCPCQTAVSASNALFNLKKAKQLNPDVPEQTAQATIVSRTVKPNNDAHRTSPWLFLVTFQTNAGCEVELSVSEEQYGLLKEGTAGKLTWQGNNLLAFHRV